MNFPNYIPAFLLFFLVINCSNQKPHFIDLPEHIQAISLLGDSLSSASSLPLHLSERIDSLIEVNTIKKDIASATIWKARLAAYHGRYKEAIYILTKQIKPKYSSQEMARFLRHRGHRYITLREFELAITDLETAALLMKETEDRIEEDGLPNAMNVPLSSLYTNVWYHLGLAYYLTQDYEKAVNAYEYCFSASSNDDMRVATLYWHYLSLHKLGLVDRANTLLNKITSNMNIIENESYLKLLLVFKGEVDPQHLLGHATDELTNSTLGYGIGSWYSMNGTDQQANQIWNNVYDAQNWAAFGHIASEVELAANH